MITIHTERHRLHAPRSELFGGELVAPFESPERVDHILARMREVGPVEVREPDAFGRPPLHRVHDAGYLDFLEHCWEDWQAAGYRGEVFPLVWPSRRLWQERLPTHIDGRIGYYAMSGETAICAGTWEAARAAADCAMTAQHLVAGGERAAFALCRPPGHHACADMFGGYCFLNNAAIAAQACCDQGAARIAVLDIDFHHGNGTQSIFYERADVLFASLHGDPRDAFPHFLGYADEIGLGRGEGFNLNYPLAPGSGWDVWGAALEDACARIARFAPETVVVSLGVDTFREDPISFFTLESDDYLRCGERIAALGAPALFVMEGGYAVAEIGVNAVNVLEGFEQG